MQQRKLTSGHRRFLNNLNLLEQLIRKSKSSKHPEMYLYQNGMRNMLFRLEGLSRMYRTVVDKKTFNKQYASYKLLEDALAQVDYYDGFLKEFQAQKEIPVSGVKYLETKKMKAFEDFRKLTDQYFLPQKEQPFFETTKAVLQNLEWVTDEKERKKIIKFIVKQIKKFIKDYKEGDFNLSDLENGLHEFRRKLRWFSIYFAALDGMIQLKKVSVYDDTLKKYMTDEVLKSPFNQFPKPAKGVKPVYITAPVYYALNWMINEMGVMKDDGLRAILLKEVIRNTGIRNSESIKKMETKILAKNKYKLNQITQRAELVAAQFMSVDRIPERLKRELSVELKK